MIRLYLHRDFKITDRNNEIKGEKNKENKNTDELKPYCQPPNTKHSILHPGNAFFSLVKVIVSSLVYSSERTNVNTTIGRRWRRHGKIHSLSTRVFFTDDRVMTTCWYVSHPGTLFKDLLKKTKKTPKRHRGSEVITFALDTNNRIKIGHKEETIYSYKHIIIKSSCCL